MQKSKASTPGVATVLWIVGSLGILIGLVTMVISLQEHDSTSAVDVALGIVICISGIGFSALGSVVDRLSRIEHHLRPPAEGPSRGLAAEWRETDTKKDS